MKQFAEYLFLAALSMATGSLPSGCVQLDESIDMSQPEMQKMEYSITVMRDGEVIAREQYGVMTRGEPAADFDTYSTMDPEKGFGIIGIDAETGDLGLSDEQKDWLLMLLMEEKKRVDESLQEADGGHI